MLDVKKVLPNISQLFVKLYFLLLSQGPQHFIFLDQIAQHCYFKWRSHSLLFIVCFTLLTFRLDPPGQAISMATQELLRLAEANPGGLASLDPVNDLQLKSIDVVQASMRLRVLQDSLKDFTCIHSPRFPEQVGFFWSWMSIVTGAVFIELIL